MSVLLTIAGAVLAMSALMLIFERRLIYFPLDTYVAGGEAYWRALGEFLETLPATDEGGASQAGAE